MKELFYFCFNTPPSGQFLIMRGERNRIEQNETDSPFSRFGSDSVGFYSPGLEFRVGHLFLFLGKFLHHHIDSGSHNRNFMFGWVSGDFG